ncbi:hypothetical protein CHI09_04470 [Shouchella clausii]|nr:hypothetical protein CHI09_04470 [Shouchella clausii]
MSVGEEFYYVSVIQDLFNNEIVSWELSKRNDNSSCIQRFSFSTLITLLIFSSEVLVRKTCTSDDNDLKRRFVRREILEPFSFLLIFPF